MESLPELVGTVHIILGPYRGNPIALYMRQDGSICQISPRVYPWNRRVGIGDTPNRAAADFEIKWKEAGLAEEMYTGPHWEGGIKPEKPKPPPKPAVASENQHQNLALMPLQRRNQRPRHLLPINPRQRPMIRASQQTPLPPDHIVSDIFSCKCP